MSVDDIYSDGTYIKSNPTLHAEDSQYKMGYIAELLEKVAWDKPVVKILDIGGGAGELGMLVADWFVVSGYTINMSTLDVTEEMVEIQKKNNPYIVNTYIGGLEKLGEEEFDLVLMIDVIEHIKEYREFAIKLNEHAAYIAYNIPTEINLVDTFRNILMHKRYYKLQAESLGHLHFFSAYSATKFVAKYHDIEKTIFAKYALYALTSPYCDYVNQRKSRIRSIELTLSAAFQKLFPWLAPYTVQGSLFCLAKTKEYRMY